MKRSATSYIQLTEPLSSSSSSSSPPSSSGDVLLSTSNIQLTEPLPCSSSSSSPPSSSWDVFLSFYGKDTRGNFITHLYDALDQAGFPTFKDDHALEKGQDILSGLLDAIKDSKMFVVVISENYAHSAWCLDELTEIFRCNKTGNQVVPVFYYVNPSDVGHHTGSFGINLQYHVDKKRYSDDSCDLLPLLNQALTGLLGKDYKVTNVASGFRQLKHRLSSNKALIVLDDLDEASYSEFLKGLCNSFSAGSRIIVTTRDVHLLNQLKNDIKEVDIHMAKELGNDDSLKLFCYHAFGTYTPPENLAEHSKSLVSYAGGLPLALKVLGSSLRGRSHVSFWLKKLEEVKQIPPKKILEILLLSYHDLSSDTEKTFFLDIACFFVGKHKVDAVEIFKSSTSYPEVEITILVERCLLEIDEKGKFHMHDLLQDMGRELGKSTRLIWRGNTLSELQKHKIIKTPLCACCLVLCH